MLAVSLVASSHVGMIMNGCLILEDGDGVPVHRYEYVVMYRMHTYVESIAFVWRSWYVGQEADVANKWLDTASFRRTKFQPLPNLVLRDSSYYRDAESALKKHSLTVSHLLTSANVHTSVATTLLLNVSHVFEIKVYHTLKCVSVPTRNWGRVRCISMFNGITRYYRTVNYYTEWSNCRSIICY